MKYTVDASVLVKLVVDEEYSQNALKLVSDQRSTLHAPSIVYKEIGSVLYRMIRRGIVDGSYAIIAYKNLIKLPIDIPEDDWTLLPNVLEMSLRLELHFYDCLYIHTAKKTGSTLVSSDQKLLNAAAKECSTKNLQDI